ncbi:hypothetical protein IKX73_00550 [Candidatus Saccharibacteria bacterium]|nr:hypothetical protein [Candidatus Saccharibacteria bacterium]
MDNGQKGQNSNDNGFFAPGTDGTPISQGIESNNNANFSSDEVNWTPERDNRSIGNKAIFSGEEVPKSDAIEILPPPEPPVEDVGDPKQEPSESTELPTETPVFDEKLIRTDGDRIARSALVEIEKAEEKLNQTGNVSDFYEEARNMMEKNLENSYNRKLAS